MIGLRHAQSHDLRTLLGEAVYNGLTFNFIILFYTRIHLLGMILNFVAQDQLPVWQEHL